MKQNFFSAVQGKFKAEFHGSYLANIIQNIAIKRIEVVSPILTAAKLTGSWSLKMIHDVSTEVAYLPTNTHNHDEKDVINRRADLVIELDNGSQVGTILVEIKINDKFLPGQLEEYINWAKQRSNKNGDRSVVFLTAFPLDHKDREFIKLNSAYVNHLYLSKFTDELRPFSTKSELISLLSDYLFHEGYAMFQIPPKSKNNQKSDDTDYKALLSFLALSFLPHEGGHGKVSAAEMIARGPAVFSYLIHNWQQVSDRLADIKLGAGRRPTIRYWPEQATTSASTELSELSDKSILSERFRIRTNKLWGRFWLSADTVLEDNVRLEWGQIIEVQNGKLDNEIGCSIYVLIRKNRTQIAGKLVTLKNGIRDQNLYSVETYMNKLLEILDNVKEKALKEHPDLKVHLKGI